MANNKGKPHIRTIERCRIAVRLELRNLGVPLQDIAAHVGMSATAYSLLRRTKLFKILKQQYFTGVLSVIDEDLVDNIDAMRRTLRSAVPMAMENIIALAADRTDKRICLEASKELMNREGHFAPVSRIGIPTLDQGGVGNKEDDAVAGELLMALNAVQKKKDISAEPETTSVQ